MFGPRWREKIILITPVILTHLTAITDRAGIRIGAGVGGRPGAGGGVLLSFLTVVITTVFMAASMEVFMVAAVLRVAAMRVAGTRVAGSFMAVVVAVVAVAVFMVGEDSAAGMDVEWRRQGPSGERPGERQTFRS